jgi:hypothetical protein
MEDRGKIVDTHYFRTFLSLCLRNSNLALRKRLVTIGSNPCGWSEQRGVGGGPGGDFRNNAGGDQASRLEMQICGGLQS